MYPEEALENGCQGKVVLTFTVDRNGNPINIQCLDTTVNDILINELIRVIKTTNGKWTPAYNDGKKVNMTYSVPFTFELDESEESESILNSALNYLKKDSLALESRSNRLSEDQSVDINGVGEEQVYEFYEVNERAVFAGGEEELYKHIALNLRYPQESLEKKQAGTVMLQFVITNKGEVTEIEQVNSGVNTLLVAEAKRVVKLTSGNWIPAKKGGVAVNMRSVIPVKFKLF